jgi:hypothetical protein
MVTSIKAFLVLRFPVQMRFRDEAEEEITDTSAI